MSEEMSVEEHVNAMAQARSPEAPAENAGTSAKPETGEDTADPDKEVPEGEDTESEEVDAEAEAEEQEAKGDDEETEEEDDVPKRKPSRAQKRIRKLVREKSDVEARLNQREAELRVLLRQLEGQGQKPNGQAQPQDQDPEPNQADYQDYLQYQKDVAAWSGRQETRKILQAERQAVQKAQAQNRQEKAEAARVEGAQGVFERGAEAYEDFQEVASTEMPITDAMTDAIMDMEAGHEVLYHLGQNPEEAERIAELRPVSQIRELTKLEAKLTGPKPKAAPKPKKTTSATEPLKPVKGAGGSRKVDPDEMPMKEYMANHSARLRSGEIKA